ncbi:MAG: c-type cytochrome [Longimonas sp.]|uniref:cytochrome c n=1 Tax=Longimonas sp. TaxID=2039626 RepID=UPI0039757AE8
MSRTDPPNPDSGSRSDASEGSVLYGGTSDELMQGHHYDGIQEYDNPMPGWWIWLLWATVAFSVVYVVGITYFDWINTYEDDLAEGIEEIEMMRQAHAESEGGNEFEVTEASIAEYVGVDEHVEAGNEIYMQNCASCHGDQGQGNIGPNLTDEYYLHGGSNVDLFNVLTDGVSDAGMPAWEGNLSPEERAQVVAFIRSIEGTDPSDAKDPEGERYEEES